ncbi:MAG: signal peptidase I, partial [Pseudomonadota bacterium]
MRDDHSDAEPTERSKESVGDIFRTVIYALLIALAFRTILFQPFSIPSGSMKSTLLIGDYLFVSKYAYGYSRFSLPYGDLLPSFGGRLLGATPERGDVIVFKQPGDTSTDYIKRLVGLPGDRIQLIRGVLHLNGEPVGLRRVTDFREPVQSRGVGGTQLCSERTADRETCIKYRSVETLPNG